MHGMIKWFLLFLVLLNCTSCQSNVPIDQSLQTSGAEDWYTLYLTHPGEAGTGLAVESALVQSILSAADSVDLALYSFSLGTVADALIATRMRGIEVHMVMEGDNMDSYQVRRLTAAGIPIRADGSDGLMHNKFVIIDSGEVWTGSMNLTITGAQEDANNLVRLTSPELAADYVAEFEAMYRDGLFGEQHVPEIPYPLVSISGTAVEVFFPPHDDASRRLVELIANARQSVVFLASNFTSDPISQALIATQAQGVSVSGLMDADNATTDTGSDYTRMLSAGIPILLDKDPGRMHHKVLIIDAAIVAFGSYNFTASAEQRNDENLLIIHDPLLAARFLKEYRRLVE